MPTFHDPHTDAAEASEAMRGLAHASRAFDNPADTYTVFGDLTATMQALRQVLDQLAATHLAHRDRAFNDDGDHSAGAHSALAVADELHHAGSLLDQAHDHLDAAFSHAGRIAWHPAPVAGFDHETGRRWVSVVFLQGEDADQVLDVIDRDGTAAAIEHLKGWDYGEESTQAALEDGYVYDEPPTGALDRVVPGEGGYTLIYNPFAGHVSLLREHHTPPADALDDPGVVPIREAIAGIGAPVPEPAPKHQAVAERPGRAPDPSWFEHPGVTSVKQSRGLSL